MIWHNAGAIGVAETSSLAVKVFRLGTNSGWAGVQLFFVLSGFLITGILLKAKETESPLRIFYTRRILRIFPLYYACLFFFFVLLPLFDVLPAVYQGDYQYQLWYWFYQSNWSNAALDGNGLAHFWSLAIEEQFYLVWPLVVYFVSRRTLIGVCISLVLSAIASRFYMTYFWGDFGLQASYSFTNARWDALAIGSMMAIANSDPDMSRSLRSYSKSFLLAGFLLILSAIAINKNFAATGFGSASLNQTLIALWFAAVIGVSISSAGSEIGEKLRKFLSSRPLATLAKYSYGMYVVHIPLLRLVMPKVSDEAESYDGLQLLAASNAFCIVVTIASLLVAMATWRLIENPFLRLKSKFNY